jgi:hypothetical protein
MTSGTVGKDFKLADNMQLELQRIMDKNPDGLLKTEEIVDAARDEDSPLHPYFNWDDKDAADRFRLEQAKQLVNHFTIYSEDLEVQVKAFSSLDSDRILGGGYRWAANVMEKKDLRAEMIRTVLLELTRIQNRYKEVEELSNVWNAIEEAKETKTLANA